MPRQKITRHIPNFLTLCNLFLGCLGIVFAFNDRIFPIELKELDAAGRNYGIVFGFNNRLYLSSFMIFGAAVLDFFDGFAARLLKAHSSLGVQLDSLADMVTFGVLPGCIYYQLLAGAFQLSPDALQVNIIYLVPSFLFTICAALRLARFNTMDDHSTGFTGLATPAAAIFTASLPLIIFTNAYDLSPLILNPWFLYGIILVFSLLMVSGIPMFSLKASSLGWKGNELRIIFALLSIFLVFFLKYTGIAIVILVYILMCLLQAFFKPKGEPVQH